MTIKVSFKAIAFAVTSSVVIAQENGDSVNVEAEIFGVDQHGNVLLPQQGLGTDLSSLAVEEASTAGTRTKGLAVPEHIAITTLFSSDDSSILPLLSANDRLLYLAAKADVDRANSPTVAVADVCRTLLSLKSSGYSGEDVGMIGQRLAEIQKTSDEETLARYQRLLSGLDEDTVVALETRKAELHVRISAFEIDWAKQSQDYPERFFENFALGCNRI